MDLLERQQERENQKNAPLADRMRPRTLDEIVGQEDILGPGKSLRRLIEADRIPSMILFGPPGAGKTTIAHVIAERTHRAFQQLSAVTSGVKDIRSVIDEAKQALLFDHVRTILFIDEIHRFNKSQQDALLPHVENGTVTLIGATTENPFFEVNKALLSRCQVVELKWLAPEALDAVLERALQDEKRGLGAFQVVLDEEAKKVLVASAGGDARVLLNSLEVAVLSTPPKEGKVHLTLDDVRESMQTKIIQYDKGDEEHLSLIHI